LPKFWNSGKIVPESKEFNTSSLCCISSPSFALILLLSLVPECL
jgi:hypothetical protein